jgi:hypothetical protein
MDTSGQSAVYRSLTILAHMRLLGLTLLLLGFVSCTKPPARAAHADSSAPVADEPIVLKDIATAGDPPAVDIGPLVGLRALDWTTPALPAATQEPLTPSPVQWSRGFKRPDGEEIYLTYTETVGPVLIGAGTAVDFVRGYPVFFRYDADGTLLQADIFKGFMGRAAGLAGDGTGYAIACIDRDGEFDRPVVIRLDAEGRMLWAQRLVCPDAHYSPLFNWVAFHEGTTYALDYDSDGLIKLDANGKVVWARRCLLAGESFRPAALAVDADGIYFTTSFSRPLADKPDAREIYGCLGRLDHSGQMVWLRALGDCQLGELVLHPGGLFACGQTVAGPALAVGFDRNGNLLFQRMWGLTKEETQVQALHYGEGLAWLEINTASADWQKERCSCHPYDGAYVLGYGLDGTLRNVLGQAISCEFDTFDLSAADSAGGLYCQLDSCAAGTLKWDHPQRPDGPAGLELFELHLQFTPMPVEVERLDVTQQRLEGRELTAFGAPDLENGDGVPRLGRLELR